MFYIAYMRQIEYPIIGRGKQCEESCMNDLQFKFIFIFTLKNYGLKIKEYGQPLLTRYLGQLQQEKQQATQRGRLSLENQMLLADEDTRSESTFDDFLTMVIQFGYLALFAPACPLAPALALINNVTEIRTDAYKWCMLYRRPIWERCDTIGAWNTVMKILALTSVATNATMICFVGSQLADPLQIEETESIDGRIASTKLWVYVMIIEHAVVILKAGLSAISPTQPQWIVDAKAELEIKRSMMITKDDANRQVRFSTETLDDL